MSQAGILNTSNFQPGSVVQTIQGNTGGVVPPDNTNNIHVIGDGTTITIAGNPGTNTLTASVIGGRAAQSFVTDAGTAAPVAGVINIKANTAATHAGSSVSFSGSGSTVQFNVTDVLDNTIIGNSAGNPTLTGTDNSSLGQATLASITSGNRNSGTGFQSLTDLTTGSDNSALGYRTLVALTTGTQNIAIGSLAGLAYTTESSNIVIGAPGVVAESNTLRLGTNGSSPAQQNRCFIAGIAGVNVGSTATVVTESANQLGTAVITAGTGITITPTANVITIAGSGSLTYTNVAATPYIVLTTDQYLSVDSSGGAITVELPNAATLGKVYVVKDRTGSAAANNITVTTVGGAVNIDAATTFVMNTAYEAISIIGNGTTYEIY